MDSDTIIRWILIFTGLLLVNLFPRNINWEWSGLLLTLGLPLFVYGVIWDK